MLHYCAQLYQGQRHHDLLKVKTHQDAEARVPAHLPGQGKHAEALGALLVETARTEGLPGKHFKLSTSFSDEQRRHPPLVGNIVTCRCRCLNDSGVPRFASFLRPQEDMASARP